MWGSSLPVTLAEMQISNTELRALDMHREEHLAPPRESFDVTVPAMLRPPRDCAGAFAADFLLQLRVRRPGVHILGLRGLGDNAVVRVRARLDQLAFALVPEREDLCRGRAPEDPWVDEPSEPDAGDVARRAKDAFEVPDGFGAA